MTAANRYQTYFSRTFLVPEPRGGGGGGGGVRIIFTTPCNFKSIKPVAMKAERRK